MCYISFLTCFTLIVPTHCKDIVLVAGSNKAIEVFDMNVGSSIRTMADVHTRAVHCIHQNNV